MIAPIWKPISVTFIVPGKPYAKKRPRFSRKIGRAFDPPENGKAEDSIGTIALRHFPKPAEGHVSVTIAAYFKIPASWPKKKAETALYAPHCQKPDGDNLAKSVLDALNRIAWTDDGQVYRITISKQWDHQDKTVITVEADR